MHMHGYKGRKFGRETDQRKALIKSLAEALIINESIETTFYKAKELVPYMEHLITKAKKGDLHSRRQIIASLQTVANAHKLMDEIAPKLNTRTSGHLRIERTDTRRGDNAQLARVSFVDDLKKAVPATKKAEPSTKPAKTSEPKPKTKSTATKTKKASTKKTQDPKLSAKSSKPE